MSGISRVGGSTMPRKRAERKKNRRAEANRMRRYVRVCVRELKIRSEGGQATGSIPAIIRLQDAQFRIKQDRLWGRVIDGLAPGDRATVRAMASFSPPTE